MARVKKSPKKCSIKGCRKKAIKNGKCREHAKETFKHAVVEKKLSAQHVARAVSHIRKVAKSGHAIPLKTEAKAAVKSAEIKRKSARAPRTGLLSTVCFWAGTVVADCNACLNSQKAK